MADEVDATHRRGARADDGGMLVLASPDTVSVYWPAAELALLTWPGGAIWTWRGRPALGQPVGRA